MLNYDYELIALACGWLCSKRGWWHPNALDMHGWWCAIRRFKTAREAILFQREEIE